MARTSQVDDPAPRGQGQRRVYVLPDDLVDRVTSYQRKHGLSSEVEAVRRLLDEALKLRDELPDIAGRFISRFAETKSIREATREVLADHPRVKKIEFEDDGDVKVILTSHEAVVFHQWQRATLYDKDGEYWQWVFEDPPDWASSLHRPPEAPPVSRQQMVQNLDDDIPF